jgi:hypothetical protein
MRVAAEETHRKMIRNSGRKRRRLPTDTQSPQPLAQAPQRVSGGSSEATGAFGAIPFPPVTGTGAGGRFELKPVTPR